MGARLDGDVAVAARIDGLRVVRLEVAAAAIQRGNTRAMLAGRMQSLKASE